MAPTVENHVASNVLATMGAVFWSIQLIPQIILNYRRGHAEGLQPAMMLLWSAAGIPLGIYCIAQRLNVALQVQAQILTTLSLVTFAQCKYYQSRWSISKCTLVIGGAGVCLAGIEVAVIFAVRVSPFAANSADHAVQRRLLIAVCLDRLSGSG